MVLMCLCVRFFCALVVFQQLRTHLKISGIFGVSLVLTILCFPGLPQITLPSGPILNVVIIGIREAWLGVLLALPFALALESLAVSGRVFDLSRGAQLAEQLYPGLPGRQSVFENALLLLGFAIIFESGAYQFFITRLVESISVFAAGGEFGAMLDVWGIIRVSAAAIGQGVIIALPIMTVSFLLDIFGGAMGKVLEKANIVTEITLVKLLVSLILLLIILEFSGELFSKYGGLLLQAAKVAL